MRIDILTLFPDTMNAILHESILGRAAKKGIIDINCVQIRDYTGNKQRQVDDYPYGGGWGCVMMAQPLKSCLDAVKAESGDLRRRVIYMSPQGSTFNQEKARQLLRDYDQLVLVCGHYEGVDERFIEQCVDEELSIGDFVLTGGELAAMAVTDCICRMVPGVLSDEQCYTGESHWDGLLEYPQYTRPECWEGSEVPEVLRNGNHADIERWRRKKMIERTMKKRPDMFAAFTPDETDAELIGEIYRDEKRMKLTKPVTCRKAIEKDLDDIMLIIRQASDYLRENRVDQWQGGYPDSGVIASDIDRGEYYVLCYGEQIAAVFALSLLPEACYDGITDGKWSSDGEYCVMHRSAVRAEFRGSGLSGILMDTVDSLAREMKVQAIRCDTHRKNKPMRRLLERKGYKYRGNIIIENCESGGHDLRRQAFEKVLDR